MKAKEPNDQGMDPVELPVDLREWVGDFNLLRLALDAVQTLDWSDPQLAAQEDQPYRPQMMMTLLTYCYSAAIYGSEDIERAIVTDPAVRYICAHNYPDARAIRIFRRQNRDALKTCIAAGLHQAWAWKLDQAEVEYLGYDWVEAILSHRIESSAKTRVEAAAIMDSLFMDC